jgi:hypothetical protein
MRVVRESRSSIRCVDLSLGSIAAISPFKCAQIPFRKHVLGTLRLVGRERTRWEEDNEARVNVAAFVTIGLLALGLAGLIVLLALT